jgi:Fe-Mn family superoxide dismutase
MNATTAMAPSILPLPFAAGNLRGLSERLLQSHHQNNYAGAVKRLHVIRAQLAALDWEAAPGFVINGLKREELIAANSMTLHELYFACIGGDGALKPSGKPAGFAVGLKRDFGSVERWRAEFIALAAAMGGGSGWALLALDMYEHAYHLDFGANAKAYVAAFMENIDWDAVAVRYAAAVEASTSSLVISRSEIGGKSSLPLIDVRRKGAFEASNELIAGADWRDPESVDRWAAEFAGREIVVYCVYGHEVGQSTAARLREAGVSARFLAGGIEAWKAAGLPLRSK